MLCASLHVLYIDGGGRVRMSIRFTVFKVLYGARVHLCVCLRVSHFQHRYFQCLYWFFWQHLCIIRPPNISSTFRTGFGKAWPCRMHGQGAPVQVPLERWSCLRRPRVQRSPTQLAAELPNWLTSWSSRALQSRLRVPPQSVRCCQAPSTIYVQTWSATTFMWTSHKNIAGVIKAVRFFSQNRTPLLSHLHLFHSSWRILTCEH